MGEGGRTMVDETPVAGGSKVAKEFTTKGSRRNKFTNLKC